MSRHSIKVDQRSYPLDHDNLETYDERETYTKVLIIELGNIGILL